MPAPRRRVMPRASPRRPSGGEKVHHLVLHHADAYRIRRRLADLSDGPGGDASGDQRQRYRRGRGAAQVIATGTKRVWRRTVSSMSKAIVIAGSLAQK